MKSSKSLDRMIAILGKYYDADLLATVLKNAERHTIARGGKEITREDWDAAQDEENAPSVVSSRYVHALEMFFVK